MANVRTATEADIERLGHTLARAFDDDPVMAYLVKPGGNRLARIARFMTMTARRGLAKGAVYTTDDHAGGALWSAPGNWRLGIGELLKQTPTVFTTFGTRIPRALRVLGRIEKAHPRAPHWYLGVLGTDPPHQGKGVGSALLEPVLERCDGEGLPAYLESSKEQNIPFYARHGFEVTDEIAFPNGPKVWGMWREPRG